MCLALPAKVLRVRKNGLLLLEQGGRRKSAISAVSGIKEGDFVLLQQGIAVEKLGKEEVVKALEALE